MNKKQKKNLIKILVAAALLILLHFIELSGFINLFAYMVPYVIVGSEILIKAAKGIKNKRPLDENLLMAIATIGAIALGIYDEIKHGNGVYTEAVAVMLFYQVGEWFQSYAVGKSRRNITELMDIRPDYANVEREGTLIQVNPDEVEVGTMIIVQPGEKIPIDGIVEDGNSTLNTAALTGESMPRNVEVGDEVISGCININGLLKIRTTREFGESTVSKILELVENASSRKSKSENFISKFARVYTPAVVITAVAMAILGPAIRAFALDVNPEYSVWIYRALTFLVASCPCALVISIPLTFFAGLGGASNQGVLIKGSNYMEQLSKVNTVVFDKTGTLTKGSFEVTSLHDNVLPKSKLLEYTAIAESASNHPISKSLLSAYGKKIDRTRVKEFEELSGYGVIAQVDDKKIVAGNVKLMNKMGIEYTECSERGTIIHVAIDDEYAGHIHITDLLKETSVDAIKALKKDRIFKLTMLTGDSEQVAKNIASQLGIDNVYSELLPAGKVDVLEKLLAVKKDKEALAFVGDGINDAPVLSRADIGIAMGAMGSDAAIEAADVVLMDDDPLRISKAIRISKKCMRIVYENIWLAIGIKLLALVLVALGMAGMWFAIFADVGVMVLAILNAIRALFVKRT